MGQIRQLGRQLKKDGIEIVTLESTSDYWRIWFFVLEACGLAVQLVNAAQARNLPGRPKTDLLTELAGRSFGWCVRSRAMLARFRLRDQRRGYAAGVVRAGGAAARLA
jgi:transposase